MGRAASKKRKQKYRARKARVLELRRQIKDLAVHGNDMPNFQVDKLEHIALGELRQNFSPQHQPLPPTAEDDIHGFKRHASPDDGKPLAIRGSDNGLLVIRVRSKNPELVKELAEAIDALPDPKNWNQKGINRGSYKSIHAGTWAAYMHTHQTTAEQRHAGAAVDALLGLAQPIFKEMTEILGGVAPDVFEAFQSHSLPPDAQRACGAWASCVINNGCEDTDEGEMHRDVRESPYGFSCAIACGDFEDGDLVLYELRRKLEMRAGDIVLFPDSLITHRNEKVRGFRKSVVAFTQANMFDYWKRCDKNYKLPWEGWQRIDTKGEKKEFVGSSRTKPKKKWLLDGIRIKKGILGSPRILRSGARY